MAPAVSMAVLDLVRRKVVHDDMAGTQRRDENLLNIGAERDAFVMEMRLPLRKHQPVNYLCGAASICAATTAAFRRLLPEGHPAYRFMENILKSFLTAAAAFALLAAPAFAQNDPTNDSRPETVPGVENNDSDTDAVTSEGVAADNVDTVGARMGTTVTATGATVTTADTEILGPGESDVVPGVENNDSDEIIQGQNDPVTTGEASALATTSVAPGALIVPTPGASGNTGGSIGVTGTDNGANATASGGIVPGQAPQ